MTERIAYLVNQYPKVSHSFIRREILALERQGFDILRIAVRGWADPLVDQEDEAERGRTRYVLKDGPLPLLRAMARAAARRPRRFLSALALSLRMSRRAERPVPVHLIYLAEACRVAEWLDAAGISHLHAHFGTNSAEVAMLVEALGVARFSVTIHGPEEFDKATIIGLPEKIRRAAFVVAISSFGRSQLLRMLDSDQWSKVAVVHCGLDRAFHAVPESPVPDVARLVCVGRLCEQKGQLLLIDAAARLRAQGYRFRLVLAGDGEMRGAVEARLAQAGLADTVEITGWISSARVRDEILASRALVLPSFAEGLPVVIMEAMALRRPVVTTYIAGIPELVHAGEHGWLVPAGDVESLAQAMAACLDTPVAALTRMGAAARERACARHDVDEQAAILAQRFRAAAADKPR